MIWLTNCGWYLTVGGPGCGKATQCRRIIERYPGWVHLSMGDLLRSEIMKRGTVDDKWNLMSNLVQEGEMAPEVSRYISVCVCRINNDCTFHLRLPRCICAATTNGDFNNL